MVEKQDLDQIVQAVMAAEHAHKTTDDEKRRHNCWRKRLFIMVAVACTTAAIGELMHLEFLFKGFEFVGECVFDKIIFGIAE